MGSTENGLNLTRATLNAILKYPWRFGHNPSKRDKWGCYEDDKEMLSWARQLGPGKNQQSDEARLMDWSDDVTYSVHDVDDFYRAGVIPLDRLVVDSEERERFYKGVFARRRDKLPKDAEIFMLKQLTWHYVIKNPALATQQHGQRVIIRQLFNAFYKAATRKDLNVDFFPISLQELLPAVPARTSNDRNKLARAIIDFIASLTEEQAIATHHRIYGFRLGSSLMFQVR